MPLARSLPGVLPTLDELVTRCLSSQVENRPGSCADFLAGLRAAKGEGLLRLGADVAVLRESSPPESERRAAVRIAVVLPAEFVPFHQAKRGAWQATILDVSSGGLCLQSAEPFPIGTVLEVTPGCRATSYLIQVRWIKALPGQNPILGCALVRPLANGEFEDLCQAGAAEIKP